MYEYCSTLWCPYKKSEIDLLESVQKRFTKRLNGMAGLQYSTRLKLLGAESLELRRIKIDLLMYFKIIFEYIDLPAEELFCIRNGITRNNGMKLYKGSFRKNAERYYFNNRSINCWNSLPFYVANASSPFIFKRCLAGIDFSKFLRSNYDSFEKLVS